MLLSLRCFTATKILKLVIVFFVLFWKKIVSNLVSIFHLMLLEIFFQVVWYQEGDLGTASILCKRFEKYCTVYYFLRETWETCQVVKLLNSMHLHLWREGFLRKCVCVSSLIFGKKNKIFKINKLNVRNINTKLLTFSKSLVKFRSRRKFW